MWLLVGNCNFGDYFLGCGYVDEVGLLVFDCLCCVIWLFGGWFLVVSILCIKYEWVVDYGLLVMVVEFGVDGLNVCKCVEFDEF